MTKAGTEYRDSAWCHLCTPPLLWPVTQLARHMLEVHDFDISKVEIVIDDPEEAS